MRPKLRPWQLALLVIACCALVLAGVFWFRFRRAPEARDAVDAVMEGAKRIEQPDQLRLGTSIRGRADILISFRKGIHAVGERHYPARDTHH